MHQSMLSKSDSAVHKSTRVVELDLLRFIAATSVVLYHWIGPQWGLGIYHVTQFGFLGVELFFLISGFVICWTATAKTGFEFVASRVARLYPSFWICLLLAMTLGEHWSTLSLRTIMANVSMIPAAFHERAMDDVYWTLFVEIKFYALIFVLSVSKQMRHIERWLAGWLALTLVAWMIPATAGALDFVTLMGLSTFFIGGCYLYLIRAGGALTFSRGAGLLLSLAAGIHCVVAHVDGAVRQPIQHVELALAAIVTAQYLIFLLVALRVVRLPPLKLWSILGAMTYPLYLLHYRAAGEFRDAFFPYWSHGAQLAGIAVACFSAALILALTVERHGCPAINRWLVSMGKRWRHAEPPPVVTTA